MFDQLLKSLVLQQSKGTKLLIEKPLEKPHPYSCKL